MGEHMEMRSIEEMEEKDGAGKHVTTVQDMERKERKEYIRRRVQNAAVTEGTVFRKAKPKPSIMDEGSKSVAVYARVSTKSEEQVSSIENQTKYYTEKIEQTPNWDMYKIYADEGKSGTSMRKRTEFKQMLKDAADKKMDLILCASVSRFARNVSDCIEQVRQLKTVNPSHPVGVYFETENIYTLDPDCGQMLSIHAMLADWESANKSRRMILSYDQRICTGQYPVSDLLGYRHTAEGDLVIVEDEAVTVRFIFLAYLMGYSSGKIAEILTAKGRKTLTGRTDWNGEMVRRIISNERRWGDLEARKTIVVDYVKGKSVRNTEIRDSAFVPNHHEGIVSREIAAAAKMVSASGRALGSGVPETTVIGTGALKGFVSINPVFCGVNRTALEELSRSVYSEEEYERLEREAEVINGKAHSNILSKDFTGYYVPCSAFFIAKDTPTLTMTGKYIKFNKKCHEKLGGCTHIEMLYHPMLQAVMIRPCGEGTGNAIQWENSRGRILEEISAHAFCEAVYDMMDWIPEYGFKFRGITRERGSRRAMVFFLDEPQILVDGKIPERMDASQEGLPSRYIPYRNRDVGRTENGMSYAVRRRRDSIVDTLTEEDISEKGIVMDNPLIGRIPTREEVRDELDELLMSM